ncbi:MAG: threonine/serine exporter family protein [Negativicutes bacterium]|nr:threonine/serine exporter family protein [Negativicutes bacterium]
MLGLKIAAVFIMGAAIGILYRIPRSVLLYASFNGTIAWLVIYFLMQAGTNVVAASFVSALIIGALAEMLARALRKPATVFIIPGFIPLVPGREAFTTMQLLVEGRQLDALSMGAQTLFTAGAIAFGIFVSITAYRLMVTYKLKSGIQHVDES